MKKMQIVVGMLFCGLVFGVGLGGCHRDAAPLLDHPQMADGVRMQDVRFYSAALKREMPYRVYLPASIAPGVKLPVVYLLHGGNGEFRDWSNYSIRCRIREQGEDRWPDPRDA